ncbi:MAG: hypothetical protein OXC92_06495 [Flavobacteriaceae bacterium]|nr:hypothetical protein [Flavobacteriaceae bacterium]MCY4253521.1 hypothetical protein [Flavobacteriaceae bacterium]
MTEKEPPTKKIIGFKPSKDLLWKNLSMGIMNYFKRPSRKMFWYNFSTVIVLMTLSGYLVGKIQNHINHYDLIKRGVPELEEHEITLNSIID